MKAVLHLLVRPRAWTLAVALLGRRADRRVRQRRQRRTSCVRPGDADRFPGLRRRRLELPGTALRTTSRPAPSTRRDTQDGCRLTFPPDIDGRPDGDSTGRRIVHHWSIPDAARGRRATVTSPGAGERALGHPVLRPGRAPGEGERHGHRDVEGRADRGLRRPSTVRTVGDCDGEYTPGTPVELTADSTRSSGPSAASPTTPGSKTCLALARGASGSVWRSAERRRPGGSSRSDVYLRVAKDGRGVVTDASAATARSTAAAPAAAALRATASR